MMMEQNLDLDNEKECPIDAMVKNMNNLNIQNSQTGYSTNTHSGYEDSSSSSGSSSVFSGPGIFSNQTYYPQ